MKFLINSRPAQTRIAQIKGNQILTFNVRSHHRKSYVGSIFNGKISKPPSLGAEACFVDIGLSKEVYLNLKDLKPTKENANSLNQTSYSLEKDHPICVQIIKDPQGAKAARVTNLISLTGRSLVYLPESTGIGISRKIENEQERQRLQKIVEDLNPKGGIIIRTIAQGKENFQSELEQLHSQWETIKEKRRTSQGLIFEEVPLEFQILRDELNSSHKEVIIDDKQIYTQTLEFIKNFLPDWKNKITYYDKKKPLFDQYGIEKKWPQILNRKVPLKTGGSIVIDENEAMVSIDVNTGRMSPKIKNSIFKTNMEAAKEIASQIKLRNCSGIIVVDFIDMALESDRDKLIKAYTIELKKDRIYTEIVSFSSLNLLQMTRKRMRVSFKRLTSKKCPYCLGRGVILSHHFIACEIFKEVEFFYLDQKSKKQQQVEISCHPDITDWIYQNEHTSIEWLKTNHDIELFFKSYPHYHLEKFELKEIKTS